MHAVDVPYMWNRIGDIADELFDLVGRQPSPQLAETMHGAWAAFVRTGVAQHASLPAWPLCDGVRRATMQFDDECRVVDSPMDAERRDGVIH